MERKKIQVVPYGEWDGHRGGKQSYGQEEAVKIVERANALVQSSGNPIQIDYEHASLNPPADGAPAAGWMYEFTIENDGIYAEVEWTPRAKEFIDNKEYKYISPVIMMGGTDPVTGEPVEIELFNAALTNQPFMHDKIKQVVASAVEAKGDGQWFTNTKQITISNSGGNMPDLKETVDSIVAALPGAAGAEDVINFLKKASEVLAIMPGAPEGGAIPTPEQMGGMVTEMKKTMQMSRIATDLAAELKIDPDKLIPTVKAMSMNKSNSDETAQRLATLEAQLKERDIADLIVTNSNRIPPAKREEIKTFANKYGIEAAKEMISQMPELPNGTRKVENSRESIDEVKLEIAKNQGISPETIKTFSNKHTEA